MDDEEIKDKFETVLDWFVLLHNRLNTIGKQIEKIEKELENKKGLKWGSKQVQK